jgi:CMP-N,N'-diacetyllegionaminic acid synthase
MTRVAGIVTARGGSKGIPRKNLQMLGDMPLIAWTIRAALESKLVDRVIVSTDDAEIAEIARIWGAEVPFMRPSALAQDTSSHIEVVRHAHHWLDRYEGYRAEYIMLLQPTTPLRTANDIDLAVDMAVSQNADSLVSVCMVDRHPYWTLKLDSEGTITSFADMDLLVLQDKYPRRQDLPPAYAENGAIYLAHPSVLFERNSFYGERLYGYVMPKERSVDIDTWMDLKWAEFILKNGGL